MPELRRRRSLRSRCRLSSDCCFQYPPGSGYTRLKHLAERWYDGLPEHASAALCPQRFDFFRTQFSEQRETTAPSPDEQIALAETNDVDDTAPSERQRIDQLEQLGTRTAGCHATIERSEYADRRVGCHEHDESGHQHGTEEIPH